MNVPSWWEFLLLSLAALRLTRLAGWDEFPLAVKVRGWATGEYAVPGERSAEDLGLPGKSPDFITDDVRVAYRRPKVAHLVTCPWCFGWWVSLACYVAWQAWPHGSLVALSPFAVSSVVGLLAKNLDA